MVVTLFVCDTTGAPMREVKEVKLVAGKGIDGDRYFNETGVYAGRMQPDRNITLIEEETIDAVRRDYKLALDPGETRRNVLTRGVALNHLIDREFMIGEVRLRGVRLCDPCAKMEKIRAGLLKAMANRGGLRATIVSGGVIRPGDRIDVTPEANTSKMRAVPS